MITKGSPAFQKIAYREYLRGFGTMTGDEPYGETPVLKALCMRRCYNYAKSAILADHYLMAWALSFDNRLVWC